MKYKLIKKYPGSPPLGYITEITHGTNMYFYKGLQICYPSKYPEFWEPVKEPEFEILELKTMCFSPEILEMTWFLQPDGKYTSLIINSKGSYTLMQMLVNSSAKIHTVKRLSDNEIFSVGDNTNNGIINKFELSGDMLRVYFEDKKAYNINLNTLRHIEPLFTTFDNISLFEGDKCSLIYLPLTNTSNLSEESVFRKELLPNPSYRLIFSTKEAAQEYIDNNKPKYSKKQVVNAFKQAELAGKNESFAVFIENL